MRARLGRFLPALSLIAVACGPMIHYERDPNVRLDSGAGWAWGTPDSDGLTLREGALVPEDSVSKIIVGEIERELVTRGFPKVRAESAQFLVHFHSGSTSRHRHAAA